MPSKMSPDLVNGLFEFGGALFMLADCFQLYHDKQVKGVLWPTRIFFFSWGLWNLFYYRKLNQPYSRAGGIALVCVNLVWCVLAFLYMAGYLSDRS